MRKLVFGSLIIVSLSCTIHSITDTQDPLSLLINSVLPTLKENSHHQSSFNRGENPIDSIFEGMIKDPISSQKVKRYENYDSTIDGFRGEENPFESIIERMKNWEPDSTPKRKNNVDLDELLSFQRDNNQRIRRQRLRKGRISHKKKKSPMNLNNLGGLSNIFEAFLNLDSQNNKGNLNFGEDNRLKNWKKENLEVKPLVIRPKSKTSEALARLKDAPDLAHHRYDDIINENRTHDKFVKPMVIVIDENDEDDANNSSRKAPSFLAQLLGFSDLDESKPTNKPQSIIINRSSTTPKPNIKIISQRKQTKTFRSDKKRSGFRLFGENEPIFTGPYSHQPPQVFPPLGRKRINVFHFEYPGSNTEERKTVLNENDSGEGIGIAQMLEAIAKTMIPI